MRGSSGAIVEILYVPGSRGADRVSVQLAVEADARCVTDKTSVAVTAVESALS